MPESQTQDLGVAAAFAQVRALIDDLQDKVESHDRLPPSLTLGNGKREVSGGITLGNDYRILKDRHAAAHLTLREGIREALMEALRLLEGLVMSPSANEAAELIRHALVANAAAVYGPDGPR